MNGPIGLRKGVATINQTPGVTAHKIGELSLWFAMLAATLVSPKSHHPLFYIIWGASQADALPAPFCLPPHPHSVVSSSSLQAWTRLWTASRVSYWCNWKCFVIAFRRTLMDVKLNEVWVLVIRVSLCEIYHHQAQQQRLPETTRHQHQHTAHTVTISCWFMKINVFSIYKVYLFLCSEQGTQKKHIYMYIYI